MPLLGHWHTYEKLISEVSEVVFILDGSYNGMPYLLGGPLLLLNDGPIVNQGLEGLSVLSP